MYANNKKTLRDTTLFMSYHAAFFSFFGRGWEGQWNRILRHDSAFSFSFSFSFSFARTIDAEFVAQRAAAERASAQYLDAAKNLDGISRELMQASHAQQAFLFSPSLSLSLFLSRARARVRSISGVDAGVARAAGILSLSLPPLCVCARALSRSLACSLALSLGTGDARCIFKSHVSPCVGFFFHAHRMRP